MPFITGAVLIVPAGYINEILLAGGGNPYDVSANAAPGRQVPDTVLNSARFLAQRIVHITQWMLYGKQQ